MSSSKHQESIDIRQNSQPSEDSLCDTSIDAADEKQSPKRTRWQDHLRRLADSAAARAVRALGGDLRRGDRYTILAAALVFTGLPAMVLGLTPSRFFNLLILACPVLLGWMLRVGVERRERGESARVLCLTILAAVFFACGWWSIAGSQNERRTATRTIYADGTQSMHGAQVSGPGLRPAQPSASRSAPTYRARATREPIDRALVGRWRRTDSRIIRAGSAGSLNIATDVYCQLNPDATFAYGGAQTEFTGRSRYGGTSGGTGANGMVRGRWKATGNVLYGKQDGQSQWVTIGRYSVSGNAMVLYPPSGGRQLWER